LCSALLPIAQGPDWNLVTNRELFLGESQGTTQGFHSRHPPRLAQFFWTHRTRIGIGTRSGFHLSFRHGARMSFLEGCLLAPARNPHHCAVRPNSRDSSRLAHVVPHVVLR